MDNSGLFQDFHLENIPTRKNNIIDPPKVRPFDLMIPFLLDKYAEDMFKIIPESNLLLVDYIVH